MKVETPGNGTGPGTPTKPVSDSLPEWSTSWPPSGETPTTTTPVSEQARAAVQDYDVNPAPAPAARYTPPETPAPYPPPTPTSGPATMPVAPYTPAQASTPPPAYAPTYTPPVRDRERESSGLIWPILLVTAGIVLLLNTLGVLSWTVWNGIGRLWPLALIFIGLEMLFGRRSRVASYVIAALLVLTIGVISTTWTVLPLTGGAVNQQSISQPLSGATSADVEISLGVGNMTVNPLANAGGDIMQGTIALGENERLERNYTVNNGVGKLTLANRSVEGAWFGNFASGPRDHVVNINPTLPLSLQIDGGVGDNTLNLADFNLTRLQVNSGVGNVEIMLPRTGTSAVSVSGGVGEVTVNVPAGTGLRVQAAQGVGSRNFPSSYTNDGEEWTSPDYNSAANRVNMQVSGGVGSLHVREVGR